MSRASEIILLCEDQLQEVTARHFLRKRGAEPRRIRVLEYPKGRGCGEQFVREKYVDELKAFRSRSARAKTLLVVVIDADTGSVADRHRQLEEVCERNGVEPRQSGEAVVHFIPKRHVETWLAYLDGKPVSETKSYKNGYAFSGREREARPLVDRLCSNSPLTDKPTSLAEACDEWAKRGANLLK